MTNYFSIKKYNDDYYKLTFSHVKKICSSGQDSNNVLFEEQYEYKDDKEDSLTEVNFLDKDYKEVQILEDFKEGKLSNNLSRAKSKVFDYAMSNKFDYFITLTLNPKKYDRNNLDLYIKNLGQFIRNYRSKYDIDIQYLLIPERHKDGSWHMHGLLKGVPDHHFIINKNGYLDWFSYSDKFGYCSLSRIRDTVAVAKYITKYISKSFNSSDGVIEKNKKLYYNSRGLKVAYKILDGQLEYKALEKIKFDFTNKYVSLKDLNKIQFLEFVGSMIID